MICLIQRNKRLDFKETDIVTVHKGLQVYLVSVIVDISVQGPKSYARVDVASHAFESN